MFSLIAPPLGFWGTRTSSVDWCEANYRYSPYVCELFDTSSSFALVLAGCFGAWLQRRVWSDAFCLRSLRCSW